MPAVQQDGSASKVDLIMTETSKPSPAGESLMAPGDVAPPGTPGTGENTCTHCGGSGTMPDGFRCRDCDGTGVVIVAIGGA